MCGPQSSEVKNFQNVRRGRRCRFRCRNAVKGKWRRGGRGDDEFPSRDEIGAFFHFSFPSFFFYNRPGSALGYGAAEQLYRTSVTSLLLFCVDEFRSVREVFRVRSPIAEQFFRKTTLHRTVCCPRHCDVFTFFLRGKYATVVAIQKRYRS